MFSRDPTLAGSVQSKKMRLRCVGRLVIGDAWTSDLEYDSAFGFAPNNTEPTRGGDLIDHCTPRYGTW